MVEYSTWRHCFFVRPRPVVDVRACGQRKLLVSIVVLYLLAVVYRTLWSSVRRSRGITYCVGLVSFLELSA